MEVLQREAFKNGVVLTLFDYSKRIAGDRWFVKIVARLEIPVSEDFYDSSVCRDAQFTECVKKKMGDVLTHDVIKERNFIDAAEKDTIITAIRSDISDTLFDYAQQPLFPQKLFRLKCEEMEKQCLVEQHLQPRNDCDEDDGPADFSDCFK